MFKDELAIKGGEPVSPEPIPLAKPAINLEVINEIKQVIASGNLKQGQLVENFEDLFKEFVGSKFAYATVNGTSALHLAYLSIIKKGDEVIIPDFTFFATASMIHYCGAKPVFADIDAETFTVDPENVKEKISYKTRAIVPVHLFGNSANINALQDISQDHDLSLIHDSAQAHGTKYNGKDIGSIGDLSCYSFYPSKTITTGEGGMVTTNDPELNKKGRLLRSHGEDVRYHHILFGFNYRLNEIQAALGINQMKQIKKILERRKIIGKYLKDEITKIPGLLPQKTTPKASHSYSYFSLTLDPEYFKCNRDEFMKALQAENIECAVHYPTPLTKQPIIREICNPDICQVSEDVGNRIFSLPIYPDLTHENMELIVKAINKVANYYLK